MKLTYFYFYLLTVLFSLINNLDAGLGPSMGPVGKLDITSIYECLDKEKYINDKISVKVQLNDVGNGKAVAVTLTSQFDMDIRMTYSGELKKMENGSWKKITDIKGQICSDIQKYIPKLWKKITSASKPKMSELCPIKASNYSIDNFQAESKDVESPTVFYGQLQVKVIGVDMFGKPWMCYMAELNSQAR